MAATNPYTLNDVTAESLAAKLAGRDESSLTFLELSELLGHLQKYRLRRPRLVTQYGPVLLRRFEGKLGQARAAVLREQILLAALDLHDEGLMEEMDEELAAAFPGGSNRRMRLHAMREEASFFHSGSAATEGKAAAIYEGMIKENYSNVLARKRQIAMARDRGDETRAVELLVQFLAIFQNDMAGWLELGELYAARNSLDEAKFCYEEVMTMNPRNPAHPFHVCRYGELLYSLGDEKNIELVEQARCYFALSVKMQLKGNLRALYGLLTASKTVLESKAAGASAFRVEAAASLKHARQEIQNYYQAAEVDAEVKECVDHVLEVFGTDN
eukprot:INCI13279.1.p1 GENE.INCI13279.1~~INCI13279.1.p1  ORF type:complete len:329 (-),score=62.68 INCI13279.1:115-1101(-)